MQNSFSGDMLTLYYSVPSLILYGPHVSYPLILILDSESIVVESRNCRQEM